MKQRKEGDMERVEYDHSDIGHLAKLLPAQNRMQSTKPTIALTHFETSATAQMSIKGAHKIFKGKQEKMSTKTLRDAISDGWKVLHFVQHLISSIYRNRITDELITSLVQLFTSSVDSPVFTIADRKSERSPLQRG